MAQASILDQLAPKSIPNLDELLAISNRLAVLNVGVLSKAVDTADVSVEEIGLLMGGIHGGSGSVGQAYEF